MIASLASSEAQIKKLVEVAGYLAEQDFAAVATHQKLAGEISFSLTAITGRFGRAALKPIYELILKEGGPAPRGVKDSLRWWPSVLPAVSPRLV